MSKSIHITGRNFRGLTKKEIEEQLSDPNSDLRTWGRKSTIKKNIIKKRKTRKDKNPQTFLSKNTYLSGAKHQSLELFLEDLGRVLNFGEISKF